MRQQIWGELVVLIPAFSAVHVWNYQWTKYENCLDFKLSYRSKVVYFLRHGMHVHVTDAENVGFPVSCCSDIRWFYVLQRLRLTTGNVALPNGRPLCRISTAQIVQFWSTIFNSSVCAGLQRYPSTTSVHAGDWFWSFGRPFAIDSVYRSRPLVAGIERCRSPLV